MMTDNPLNQPSSDNVSGAAEGLTPDQLQLLATLAERWDEFEGLLEGTASRAELDRKLHGYLSAQTAELKQLKLIRLGVNIGVGLFVVCVALSLWGMIFLKWPTLRQLDPTTSTAIVVGAFSSIVVLLVAVIRGSYRLATDRNKESDLPNGIKELLKAFIDSHSS
ncbi:hypothetical protein [Litorimonas sp. WD9-15]|uniref:hypothetical protein n=1 Tax=Litorimonas sp. WD9-15 TaxID=3418716 RepID=UPI003D0004C6